MKDILWMLYRKAPSPLVSKDIHGVGPVEYAVESNLEFKLILTLQDMIGHCKKSETGSQATRYMLDALSHCRALPNR